jgi:uncharacterized delta-60 repeat protein
LLLQAAPTSGAGGRDPSFSTDGVATAFESATERALAMAIQSDGKIVVAGFSNDLANGDVFAAARFLTDGTLDDTFGSFGVATIAFDIDPNTLEVARSVAIQQDGKIVLAGNISTLGDDVTPATSNFGVARLNANGSPDMGFSTDGKDVIDFGSFDRANAVAVQTDQKIVVGGFTGSGDFALARYEANGTLDDGPDAFDGDGLLTTNFGGNDQARALAIEPDGQIVAVGFSAESFALARYGSDGALDTAFDGPAGDGNGKFTYSSSGFGGDRANAIAVQLDGKLVVAGESGANTQDDFTPQNGLVVRFNPDGTLDLPFGLLDGRYRFGFGSSEHAGGVAVASDGTIVVTGWSSMLPDGSVPEGSFLLRLTSDGDPDPTFDGDGVIHEPDLDAARAVAIQADGKIVIAGHTSYFGGSNDMFAARYLVSPDLQLSAPNAKAKEGKNVVFTVTLDRPSDTFVTFNYSTVPVNAKPDKDYTPVSGSMGFPLNTQTVQISVPTKNDRRDERNEKFKLIIDNVAGAQLVDGEAIGKIVDND